MQDKQQPTTITRLNEKANENLEGGRQTQPKETREERKKQTNLNTNNGPNEENKNKK